MIDPLIIIDLTITLIYSQIDKSYQELTFAHLDDHFCPACAFSCSSEDQLIAQLEYYFSQDNIITDHYLRSQMDDEVRFLPFKRLISVKSRTTCRSWPFRRLPRSNSTLRTSKTRSSSLPPWSRTRVTFYRSVWTFWDFKKTKTNQGRRLWTQNTRPIRPSQISASCSRRSRQLCTGWRAADVY